MNLGRILCWGLALISTEAVFSEQQHQGSGRRRTEAVSLSERVGFVSVAETGSDSSTHSTGILREQGKLFSGTEFETSGLRISSKGSRTGNADIELFGVFAGRAKTFQAAQKLCTGLPPLGKWRVASLVAVKAFFEELLPGFPVPNDPHQLGFLFWAESEDAKFNKNNRNTFFTTPKGADLKVETQSYTEFINRVRRVHSQSLTAQEKDYAAKFIEFLEEGIPLICVFGEG